MSFKTVTVVLASAVASAGTFTVNYPSGTTAGDFASYGHSIYARGLQAYFEQDAGKISIAFGASNATVTYNGSTSIPAGTEVTVQMNIRGTDDRLPAGALPDVKRTNFTTLVRVDLGAPATADADGIAASQSVSAAGSFTINGALASGGKVVFDVPRNVVASWTTTSVLTITGKDEYGNTMVENSASGTSHTGKKAFKEITSVTSSASITSATVGSGDVIGLPIFVEKVGHIVAEMKNEVIIPKVGGGIVYVQGHALEAAVDAGTGLNLISPVAGFIRKMSVMPRDTVTTGGAVTLEVNTVAVNGLSVTIADGATEGSVATDTPTKDHATTAVAVGDRLEVQFASAINASADFFVVIEIEATYGTDGTFVAGVQTAATATTGDVRGTYDPSTACDGSANFALLVASPDPTYLGVDQYDG